MEKSILPCPMCGHYEDEHIDRIRQKEKEQHTMKSFVAGRRSWKNLSRRENDVFDAFYDLGMTDFSDIAKNFDITIQSARKYYERAMKKISQIL